LSLLAVLEVPQTTAAVVLVVIGNLQAKLSTAVLDTR